MAVNTRMNSRIPLKSIGILKFNAIGKIVDNAIFVPLSGARGTPKSSFRQPPGQTERTASAIHTSLREG